MSQPEKYICHGEEIKPGTVIETENLETFTVKKVKFNMVHVSDQNGRPFPKTKAQFRKWFRENGCIVVPTN
tara:strand:- start:24 stop:236 length:213 start_codon:yes stop_codon:yes gene_type:complete